MRQNIDRSPAHRRRRIAPVAKLQPLTVSSGKPQKPNICVADVIEFIEQASRRQLRIISNIMEVRTFAEGIPSIGFNGIALASVLSFAASASREERKLIAETLKEGRAAS